MRKGLISLAASRAGAATALLLAVVLPAQMVLAPAAYAAKPTPPPPPPPVGTVFESTDPMIAYTGTWTDASVPAASAGSYRTIDAQGSSFVTFQGTGISLLSAKGPTFGKLEVTVDDGAAVTVDLYSSSASYQQTVWSSAVLAEGPHTARLSWTGTKNAMSTGTAVNADAVVVAGSLVQAIVPPQPTRYESTDPSIRYSGTWSDMQDAAASAGSYRRTNAAGTGTVIFSGTSIALISRKGPACGQMSVAIDGGTATTVDLYSSAVANQQKVWSRTGLSSGSHTVTYSWTGLKNKKATSTEVNVDAVDVVGSLAAPVIDVTGEIAADTVWAPPAQYRLSGTTSVKAGVTLTISPGTVVKFAPGATLRCYGRLDAGAVGGEPVAFTSLKDDSLGGDTNLDSSETTPAAGDWAGLRVYAGSDGSTLENCVIRYAQDGVYAYQGSFAMVDSAVTLCSNYGVKTLSLSSPSSLVGCLIQDNAYTGIYSQGQSPLAISSCTVTENGRHGIALESSSVTTASVDITGCTIAGNGTTDYASVYVDDHADVSVEQCTLGGGQYGISAMTNSVVSATGNTVTDCGYAPYRRSGDATLELAGETTHGSRFEAIHLSGTVTKTTTVGHEGLPYVIDGQWTIDDSAAVTVEPGAVFKLLDEYDTIVIWGRFDAVGNASDRITFTSISDDAVGGDTNADGSATAPAPGSWYSVRVTEGLYGEGPGVATFDYCDIKYGGYGSGGYYGYGALACSETTPTISNSRFLDNLYSGIEAHEASPVVSGCLFERNGNGISFNNWSTGTVADCEFRNQRNTGIWTLASSPSVTRSVFADNARSALDVLSNADDPVPEAHYNDFLRNGSNGTTNLELSWYCPRIDVRYNYWGRTSGPSAIEQSEALCEPWLWYSFKTPASAQVLGGNTPCGIWGEPINTSTGNFYYEASDLTLPGVGPDISVGRTYNHQDASSGGVLGYGWTLDCDSFVQSQFDGSALVVYPGGARKTFTSDGSGGYVAPQGTLETLAATATGWTLTYRDRTVNTYGPSGTLLTVADRYGNMVLYTRNTTGAITRIEGAGGRFVAFTYTGDLLTKIADNAGRQVTYTYSAAGDLATVTDTTGAVTTFTSDAQHRVTQVASAEHPTDPFVSHGYDDQDRVAVQYDGYGNVGTLSYSEGATTITNNRGYTQVHQFDDEYRLTAETDGAGDVSTRTYNAAGLLATVTDANDHTASFTYDGNGNTTSATDAAGHASEASYDLANNNLLWSEDAEGVRTTYAYDATGAYLEQVANPVFEVVYGHYANGLVSNVTLAGATTYFGYDAAGRLTSVTDSLGATSTVAYDVAGNVTSATDAMGRAASFTYDAAGRVLTASDSLCATATFSYDLNGNRTSATDQLGRVTHFSYDELDKLAGVTDPLSNAWAYTYDPNYNLSSVTNPKDATTSYTYSADDLLTETEDALGHTWAFTHDAAGNTLSSAYPTGETVSRTYTADDLLAQSEYSTGESYAFAYTPTHRLAGVTGTGGTLGFTYNPVGWLLSATDTSDGQSFATTYAYDEAGRVTSLDSAAAPAVAYAYDLAGRLTSLEASGAVATFTHDAPGARTGVTLPNGALTSFGYDAAGRIESIVTTATSGVIAESYTRDAAGRVTEDSSGTYAYDDAGRLITWTAPGGEVTTYTYDAASNLTGESVDGSATAAFAYDAADRITSAGFTFDDAGSLTSDGERLFSYDAACRLVAVKDAATGATIATHTYDAFNRRVSSTEGTATVFFHYDGASARVIAETDSAGATLASYAYDSAGNLFSMTRGSETYYYHTNARGDVVALSDSTGAVVNTYAYDPWGTLLSESETVSNPYRYASYRYDSATGLSYCWNRYYAPELARFLTRDIYPGELSDPVTMNPYLYCGGDPVNRVDPSGMWTWALPIIGSVNVTWQNPAVSITTNQLTFDDDGNVGIMQSGGIGLGTGWGGSLGYAVQRTNADTIHQLEGPGFVAGASGTALVGLVPVNGGAEYCSNWKHEYSGFNAFLGIGFGNTAGVLPVEGHGEVTYSTIPISFNVHDVWAKLTGR